MWSYRVQMITAQTQTGSGCRVLSSSLGFSRLLLLHDDSPWLRLRRFSLKATAQQCSAEYKTSVSTVIDAQIIWFPLSSDKALKHPQVIWLDCALRTISNIYIFIYIYICMHFYLYTENDKETRGYVSCSAPLKYCWLLLGTGSVVSDVTFL